MRSAVDRRHPLGIGTLPLPSVPFYRCLLCLSCLPSGPSSFVHCVLSCVRPGSIRGLDPSRKFALTRGGWVADSLLYPTPTRKWHQIIGGGKECVLLLSAFQSAPSDFQSDFFIRAKVLRKSSMTPSDSWRQPQGMVASVEQRLWALGPLMLSLRQRLGGSKTQRQALGGYI